MHNSCAPSLHGLRILNTRPKTQYDALHQAILQAGGKSIALPVIEIGATDNAWKKILLEQSVIHKVIFISPNAVDYFMSGLNPNTPENALLPWSSTTQILAIGSATAAQLSKYHIPIHALPSIADSENLLELSNLHMVQQQTILIVKGTHGRDLLEHTLQTRGANVVLLPVYTTRLPQHNEEKLQQIWQENQVDLILYTSQQSITNTFTLFQRRAHQWLCKKPSVVISARIATYAASLGIKTIIQSCHDDIIKTLEGFAHEHRQKT